MKKNLVLSTLILVFMMIHGVTMGQKDAMQILQNVDNILNAPKDQSLTVVTYIVDRRGNESTRELTMLQKGSDKRLVKFLAPADQKGIGFLSLPGDNLTLYMPAYGKTRKVGGHVKNTKFAGTDYTYEDMEAKRYTERYDPKLIETNNDSWVLELVPKDGIRSDYTKLHMTIRRSDNYPVKIAYFDKAGVMVKTLESSNIQKTGEYWLARQTKMTDLKTKTSTRMEITNVKFDTGINDDVFTERYLMR
ncbi:MAG: outer membrane lipoprotein-sorting protein [Bacteroidales bacterium]